MKRLFIAVLILLIPAHLYAAAPTRVNDYVSGTTIRSNDVEENEDEIFSYLQLGVDTLRSNALDALGEISTSLCSDDQILKKTSGAWACGSDLLGTDAWTVSGDNAYLTTTTREVILGATTPVSSAKLSINGDADQIQGVFQGHSTQTSDILVVEKSDGTDVLTVEATNVGVGTANPTDKLQVNGSVTVTTLDTGQGANELYDMDQNVLTTSSPTFANLYTSTNVGAGTTIPTATLEIIESGDTPFMVSNGAGGGGDLFFIDTNGNVGIGETTPVRSLQVTNASTAALVLDESGTANWSALATGTVLTAFMFDDGYDFGIHSATGIDDQGLTNYLYIGRGDTTNSLFGLLAFNESDLQSQLGVITSAANKVAFKVKAAASQTADLTQWLDSSGNVLNMVDANGNVGVGTTSTAKKLEVSGALQATDIYSGDGTQGATTTISVRKGDDSGACTITVKDGLITGDDC